MKYLLLPSSFPAWSWEDSNGNATAEQTHRAYQALLNGGQCADFSRYVWNDLADKINGALKGAGLSWNNSYATLYNSKVLTQYGSLTAVRFNSLRNNAGKEICATWPWAFDNDFTGYIGREDFIGANQTATPDEVFGAYIIELARKVNTLISVLKNEADFGELQAHLNSLAAVVNSELTAPQSARIGSILYSSATLAANLDRINTQGQLRATSVGHSGFSAGLDLIQLDNVLKANIKAGIGIDEAAMELFRWYARLRYTGVVQSVISASLVLSRGKSFTARVTSSASITAASLSAVSQIKLLHSNYVMLSPTEAVINSFPAFPIISTHLNLLSENEAALIRREIKAFRAASISYGTLFRHTAKACPAVRFVPLAMRLHAAIDSTANSFPARLLQAPELLSEAVISSAAVSFPCICIPGTEIVAESSSSGEVQVSHISIFADTVVDATSTNAGMLQTKAPLNMELDALQAKAEIQPLALIKCQPLDVPGADISAEAESSAALGFYGDVWLYPVKTGENLYVRQVYSTKQFDDDLFLDAAKPTEISATISATAEITANMTAEVLWIDPVQTGEDLYIRQVYYSAKAEDDLQLYRAWNNPVQTDDNLYICQAEDLTQTNNDLEVN